MSSLRSPRFGRPERPRSLTSAKRRLSREAKPSHERLEDRCLLSLLNLAQSAVRPDIASGIRTNISYVQQGNNANPFHYDATALTLTQSNGTTSRITTQSNKTPARVRLDLTLDNSGGFAGGVPGPGYAVNGKVTVNAQTYDGSLLTAAVLNFGFADAFSKASGEFDVRLVVTGGLLSGVGGPYKVGDNLAMLIHQPGLSITRFPATFSLSNNTSGISDTLAAMQPMMNLMNRAPMTAATRPPTNDAGSSTTTGANCGCGTTTGANANPGQDTGTVAKTALYDGAATYQTTDLVIPGRGVLTWALTRTYRSDVSFDGPLGNGWEMTGNRRLKEVTLANIGQFTSAFPSVKVGDVLSVDGYNRDDLYILNTVGSPTQFTSPAGYYTNLVKNGDGSYTERSADGIVTSYRRPDAGGVATMASMADPEGNTLKFTYDDDEKLLFAYDTMGRPYQFFYDSSKRLVRVTDFTGRSSAYAYDANGNLVAETSPTVTGTPDGNDFPLGKTERYTYSSGFADPRLNHNLLTITAPNEVASGGPPRVVFTYDTTTGSPNIDRVLTYQEGGTNASAVAAGGTISYQYQTLASPPPGDVTTPARRTTVTDRNGNITVYEYNQKNNTLSTREFNNRGIRNGDPTSYTTQYTYDADYRLTRVTPPLGNPTVYTYDTANPSRFQQGDLLSETRSPDATRSGDQASITTTFTYEPIYDHVRTVTEPRGNDPNYLSQNGGVNSAARYTTTYTYDYQEGTNFAALGASLGISAAAAAARLAAAGVPMGLGDVNGDGRTDQIPGKTIRTRSPNVNLLPGSNQAAVEGSTVQPIVTTYVYNDFGQLTRTADPEKNVTTYDYYPERDPNGDGVIDNPVGNPTTGGYLMQETRDTTFAPGRDSGTDPSPANIRTSYQYDARGNVTRRIDGRGIATDYTYSQLDQVVQIVHAAAHDLYVGPPPVNPVPLVDFQYLERFFYDANNNMVLHQVEDRGNTSNVDGNLPAGSLPVGVPGASNPDPVGGPAFVDTVTKYDILDQRVETVKEVSEGATPESLRTRYRYDPNGNGVLTIQPEGNADAAIYDERDLLFRSLRGVTTKPELQPDSPAGTAPTLLAPGDPTNYDVRGGIPCSCETFRYDSNGNLVESVNADNNDLASTAIDPTLGPGNRTRYIYDGFDRRTSTIDSVGNQTATQYDPFGNVVRTTSFGPVDFVNGMAPTADGTPLGPVSTPSPTPSATGVIQSGNLVKPATNALLAATEFSYDELGRTFQASRVLFVNTIPTTRTPDVAEGGSDVGLGNLTPGQTQAIPGVSGVTILGRVSNRSEYDRNSRTTFTVQDNTNTTRAIYDGVGRVIKTLDPVGNTVEMAYDSNNNVIEIRETDVSQVAGVAPEVFLTTIFYDALNRAQETIDNLGQTTQYRYDSRGNLVAVADANGPPGPVVLRRAFPDGPRTVDTTNLPGNVTQYFYDGLSRRVREDQILTASHLGDGVNIGATIEGIKSATPTADPAQGGGDGIIRTGWNYDKNSLLSSLIDDQGNVTAYLYDDLNRKVTETKGLTVNSAPLNNAKILGPRVVPTPAAATINNPPVIPAAEIDTQLAEAKARINAVASLFPPLANSVDDHPPTTIVWGYSPNDLVLIVQDENGSETFTKYDAIARPIATRTFRAGQSDTFTGDPIFAPAPVNPIPTNPSTVFPAVVGTNRQNYQYDGLSRLTLAFDNNDPTTASDDSKVTDAYDSLSRIIEEAQTIGGLPTKVISSAWRADALRSKLTYPNNRAEVYTYDRLDRIKTIADQSPAQTIATYDYMGVSRVLNRIYPQNGTKETFLSGTTDVGYDGLRRPVQLRVLSTNPANPLVVGFTHTYDRVNNKLTEGKLHNAPNSETYTYDSAYRLVTFNRGPGGIVSPQTTWTLDGVGNWKQVDNETRQHSSFNEITQRSTGGPATVIRSDDNGNEIDDGTFLYSYDAMNRLRTVTLKSSSALIATYSYDALGRRIQKVVTNSDALNGTTSYYLDGWQEIEEHNAADAVTQQYVYGITIDEPLIADTNLTATPTRFFYHQNTLGSVYALTDTSGKTIEGYQYDAYGKPTVFTPGPNGNVDFGGDDVIKTMSAVGNPYLFTGRRLDGETGLYYYRARFLDSVQGRFIQRDPLEYIGGVNMYEYVGDRPTFAVDPVGHQNPEEIRATIRNIEEGIAFREIPHGATLRPTCDHGPTRIRPESP